MYLKKAGVTTDYPPQTKVTRPSYGQQKAIKTLQDQNIGSQRDANSDGSDGKHQESESLMLQRWLQEGTADGPYHAIASVASHPFMSTNTESPSKKN